MKDKGTKNAIFVLRMLSERAIQMQQTMYLCFVDWKKAFDSVDHENFFNFSTKLVLMAKISGSSKYCIMSKLLMLKLVMT